MKKLFVTLCLLATTLLAHSQIPKPQTLKDFSTWSITPFASFTYENTDIEANDPFYTRTALNRGLGLELSKQLSHFTSIQLNGFNGNLNTEWRNYKYNTDVSQLDLRFRFNMTNGSVFRKYQSTQLYAFVGYGVLWYDATKKDKSTGLQTYQVTDITRVIPFGAGIKYRLGNRTSLSADMSYNHTNTDDLDTWSDALTSKDGFTRINVGFTYNIGKTKILEWDQPFAYLVPESVHDTTVVIKEIKYVAPTEDPIDSATIYFTAGSWEIEFPYLNNLDKVIERCIETGSEISIESYCDTTGSTTLNEEVVNNRASRVVKYLTNRGVSEDRIYLSMFDESHALYMPNARNRKVVVKIKK